MAKPISFKELAGGGYGDFCNTKKRYRVCKGSRGSKKSKTTALDLIKKIVQYPQANVLCVRRFQSTIRDSQFSDLKWAILRMGLEPYFHFTVNPLEITYLPTGQKILFRGLDDGMKVTSISVPVGVLCFVWIEEAYEITNEDDFNKLDMSIRGEVPEGLFKQITLTFNPWSENCWLKKRFFDTPSDNVFTKTTTYRCNEWLDESDLAIFEDMQKNNKRRAWVECEGNWGIVDGIIFERFRVEDFDVEPLRSDPKLIGCYGLDFGFTDPTAFVACIVDQANKNIYVFDEWYARGQTNEKIAQKIKEMGYGSECIIADSAEPKSIVELGEKGLRVEGSRKGGDSVNHGIQLLQNYTFIIKPKCKEVYREISNYCWAKDRNGKSTDKPDHEFSHTMDAIRYAVCKSVLPDCFSFD